MSATTSPHPVAPSPSATEALLAEIESYCAASGIAETTFGQKAVKNWRLVESLRSGKCVTLRTADRVRAFIAAQKASAAEDEIPAAPGDAEPRDTAPAPPVAAE